MKKTLERTVEQGFCGTVKTYARQVMGLSSNLLKRTKMSGGVFVNGEPAFVIKELKAGDTVSLVIENDAASPNVFPRAGELDIIYRDDDLLVINKQAPLPVHPSKGHVDDSLANRVTAYFAAMGENYTTRIVTRLDSGTSGLMVLAMHAFSHNELQKQLHEGFRREYLAVTNGAMSGSGIIDAPIKRMEGATIKRACDILGQRAVTHYSVEAAAAGCTLVRLRLETGRTHQIRVHLSSIGHPIIGDFLYGEQDERIARCALHSCRISFLHPLTKQPMEFFQPLPEDMLALLK